MTNHKALKTLKKKAKKKSYLVTEKISSRKSKNFYLVEPKKISNYIFHSIFRTFTVRFYN